MRKPNYNFERSERERAKQAKADAKAQKKAEALREEAALERPSDVEAPEATTDEPSNA